MKTKKTKKKKSHIKKRLIKILELNPLFIDDTKSEVSDFSIILFNTSESNEQCGLKLTIRDENEDEILFHTEDVELTPNSENEFTINLEIPLINQIAFEVRLEIFQQDQVIHSTNWSAVFEDIENESVPAHQVKEQEISQDETLTEQIETPNPEAPIEEEVTKPIDLNKLEESIEDEVTKPIDLNKLEKSIEDEVTKPIEVEQVNSDVSFEEEETEQIQLSPAQMQKKMDTEPSIDASSEFADEKTPTEVIETKTEKIKPVPEKIPVEELDDKTSPAIENYDSKSFKSSWGVVIEEQEDHLFQETSSPVSDQKIPQPEEKDSKVKIEDADKILSSEFKASKPKPVKETIEDESTDKLPNVSSILDIADKKPEPEVKKPKESVPEKLIKDINSIKEKKDIKKKETEDKKPEVSEEKKKTDKEITIETLREELLKEEEEEFGAYTIDSSEDEEDEFNSEETQIDFMQSNLSSQEKDIREYTNKPTPGISDSIKTFNVDREELSQYDKKPSQEKIKKRKKIISKKALRNIIILFIIVSISSIAAMVFNPFDNQNNIKVIKDPIKTITPNTSTKPINANPDPENGGIDIDITDEINELLDSEIVDEEFWIIEIATYKDKAEAYKTITNVKKLGYKAEIEKIGNKFTVLINHVENKKTESIIKKLKAAGFNPSKEAEVIF